ncbi:hypothetical protein GDO81_011095 [Engystomops pustulosus]|uniref:Uncharacterized protein n=1 Tax=Engystomops pustulosus TaxID=76066 RepID=A0AAV7C668_ENGPU|nr:hypothetical protein GDO81_011095 [Engystomops pustulosus]
MSLETDAGAMSNANKKSGQHQGGAGPGQKPNLNCWPAQQFILEEGSLVRNCSKRSKNTQMPPPSILLLSSDLY